LFIQVTKKNKIFTFCCLQLLQDLFVALVRF